MASQIEFPILHALTEEDIHEIDHKPIDLSQFFGKERMKSMGDYEQMRYQNMTRNYYAMLKIGMEPKKPDFMTKKYQRKSRKDSSESESDTEWKPGMRKKKGQEVSVYPKYMKPKKNQRKSKKKPEPEPEPEPKPQEPVDVTGKLMWEVLRMPKPLPNHLRNVDPSTLDPKDDDEIEEFDGFTIEEIQITARYAAKAIKKNWATIQKLRQEPDNEEALRMAYLDEAPDEDLDRLWNEREKLKKKMAARRRYPRRNLPPVDYSEIEVPNEDSYLFCDDCNEEHLGDCPIHGPLSIIHDAPTATDGSDPKRGEHSAPEYVAIHQSTIRGAGEGAFANQDLWKGMRFGPYQGLCTRSIDEAHASGYAWEVVSHSERKSFFVDASDEAYSNWMRYVNCARNIEEQNLVAFQYEQAIFYRTMAPIRNGTELLVWYGESYAKDLGIDIRIPQMCASVQSKAVMAPVRMGRVKPGQRIQPVPATENPAVLVYSCDECSVGYSTEILLLLHKKSKHGMHFDISQLDLTEQHNCDKCGRTLTSADSLLNHKECHLLEKSNGGPVENMTRPSLPVKKSESKQCDATHHMSGDSGSVVSPGLTGQRKDKAGGSHVCDVCGKELSSAQNLTIHQRTHTGDRPYRCNVCGHGCTSQGNLTRHQLTHTVDRPYRCKVCGKGFTQSLNLTIHERTHTGDKPYRCNVCGKEFTQSHNLTIHQRTHTGDRPYRCNVCGQGCTTQGNLTKHQHTHTGDRPYRCNVCGKGFTRPDRLTSHQRIHTGDRPYRCNVCGKGYTDYCNFTRHQRTHTGDRPFKCNVCGKGFTQSYSLTTHQYTHTGEWPHQCDICGKGYNTPGQLRSHLAKH